MGDVGVVTRIFKANVSVMGTVPMRVPAFLHNLDILLQYPGVTYSARVMKKEDWQTGNIRTLNPVEDVMAILGKANISCEKYTVSITSNLGHEYCKLYIIFMMNPNFRCWAA